MTTDFTRDRWGRPLIIPPDGGKPVPYGRFSSHGQILEDRFGLERWKVRVAGKGLASRPDLFAQVSACPADDTKRLDELMQAALDAGGATVGAGIGTALHEFTARVEAGDIDIADVPDPWKGDVEVYLATIAAHGFEVVRDLVEVQLVNDHLQLAGTADRFYRRPDGILVCADLKTGKKISPNPLAYIVQLAAYANSVLYNIETGERTPVGPVDLAHGVIVHLPSGEGRCHIYEVDLIAGVEAAEVATLVKQWQKRKGLVTKVSDVSNGTADVGTAAVEQQNPPAAPAADIRRRWVADRVRTAINAGGGADLARLWPADVPTLKSGHAHTDAELDAVIAVLVNVEAAHAVTFAPSDPMLAPKPRKRATAAKVPDKPAPPPEGPEVSADEVDALKAQIDALFPSQKALIGAWTSEAAKAGRTLSLRELPSMRRLLIARAMHRLALLDDEDVARAAVALVHTDALQRSIPLGAIFGALTIAEASSLDDIAAAIPDGPLGIEFDADGVRITGDHHAYLAS